MLVWTFVFHSILELSQFLHKSFLFLLFAQQHIFFSVQLISQFVTSLCSVLPNDSFFDDSLILAFDHILPWYCHRHFAFQHHLQLFDLVHVLSEQSILRILVYFRLILYKFSPTRVSKSAQSLIIVVVCRRKCSNHDSFCVTSERILKQTGQFWITIRYVMYFSVDQSRNDVT